MNQQSVRLQEPDALAERGDPIPNGLSPDPLGVLDSIAWAQFLREEACTREITSGLETIQRLSGDTRARLCAKTAGLKNHESDNIALLNQIHLQAETLQSEIKFVRSLATHCFDAVDFHTLPARSSACAISGKGYSRRHALLSLADSLISSSFHSNIHSIALT